MRYTDDTLSHIKPFLQAPHIRRVGLSAVPLKDNWFDKLQISIKLVTSPTNSNIVEKIRLQVTGDVTNVDRKTGALKAYFRGYDQVVLQNLMQDLQAKLGAV